MPKSIGTDNGREFKNILLKNYMDDNNIKYITGLPYKPHSQGVCERVHKTIKAGLIVKKLENPSSFNLDIALEKTILSYNNTVHKVINATPFEVFYSTNKSFLKTIKNNIKKFYQSNNSDNNDVELDDKILISNNIIVKRIKKNNLVIIEKNKVKKSQNIYNICGEVIDILEGGLFDILISSDYESNNLFKNDICRIERAIFKVVNLTNWLHILNEQEK